MSTVLLRQQTWDENNLFKQYDMSGRSADRHVWSALWVQPTAHLSHVSVFTVPSWSFLSMDTTELIRRWLCPVVLQHLLRADWSLTAVLQDGPAVPDTTSPVSEAARVAHCCRLMPPGDDYCTRSVFFATVVLQDGGRFSHAGRLAQVHSASIWWPRPPASRGAYICELGPARPRVSPRSVLSLPVTLQVGFTPDVRTLKAWRYNLWAPQGS